MKTYTKPVVEIVELSAKESIAANDYAKAYKAGITSYSISSILNPANSNQTPSNQALQNG